MPLERRIGSINKTRDIKPNDLPIGSLVQVSNVISGASATGTTVIPVDDTVPVNTEGDQYMTLTHTPKRTTNMLYIHIVFCGSGGADGSSVVSALFKDTDANALRAAATRKNYGTNPGAAVLSFVHPMVAGTTSAITFKVRGGMNLAGTFTFNGQSDGAGQMFGGVNSSSITIYEVKS